MWNEPLAHCWRSTEKNITPWRICINTDSTWSAGHYVYDTGNCKNRLVTHHKNRELFKDLLAGYRWDAGCFQGAHLFQSVSLLILGSLPPFCSNLQDTNAVLKSLLHNRNLHQLENKYSSQFHAAYIYWSLVILLTQHGCWSGVGCFAYNTFQVQRDFLVHTRRKCGAWMKDILYRIVEGQIPCQEVLAWVWASVNWNRLLFIQIQPLPPSTHHKWGIVFDTICKTTNK